MNSLRLLILSTPVGPLGSGRGGGVELTVANLARVMRQRGHRVAIAAPAGSVLSGQPAARTDALDCQIEIIQISGSCQPTAQTQNRSAPVIVGSALANTWAYARQAQANYDLLINFAYDWLPFYLTPFLTTPVAHFVSMGSLSDCLDEAIFQLSAQFPGTLGAYTRSQADTFVSPSGTVPVRWKILGSAIDIAQYDYCDRPGDSLAWVGRISPEKGLTAAIAAAVAANRPLKIFGKLETTDYWQSIQQSLSATAAALITYCGFLPTPQLQQALGHCQALLVTPQWVEAFGIGVIEALACGVPVIAYRRGGPAEIVCHGKTGWLVEPGDQAGMVAAIAKIEQIDRYDCRQQAETMYSLAAWGDRCEQWFDQIISGTIGS
ncbi:glycosyltransferase family 4 protein [soil metagenome]